MLGHQWVVTTTLLLLPMLIFLQACKLKKYQIFNKLELIWMPFKLFISLVDIIDVSHISTKELITFTKAIEKNDI